MTAILGISAFYHDSAAALVVDGEIVAAAQEERFTRRKHDPAFPAAAVAYCLREGGLDPGQLDHEMNWSDIPLNPGRRVLRQFAALWIFFFVAPGATQFLAHGRPGLGWSLMAVGLIVGIPGVLRPSLLRRIFVAWMVLAFPIGWLVSTLMLLGLYFLVFTPLALFFRLRGRDWLRKKPAPEQDTFWEPKENPLDPLSYFRQH